MVRVCVTGDKEAFASVFTANISAWLSGLGIPAATVTVTQISAEDLS